MHECIKDINPVVSWRGGGEAWVNYLSLISNSVHVARLVVHAWLPRRLEWQKEEYFRSFYTTKKERKRGRERESLPPYASQRKEEASYIFVAKNIYSSPSSPSSAHTHTRTHTYTHTHTHFQIDWNVKLCLKEIWIHVTDINVQNFTENMHHSAILKFLSDSENNYKCWYCVIDLKTSSLGYKFKFKITIFATNSHSYINFLLTH